MKNILAVRFAAILLISAIMGCDAPNGPVATNIDAKIKELTTWTPKAIAKDPVGFMTHAISAADNIVLELRAAQIGIAQQRNITDRKMASNASRLAIVKALFAEYRAAYQEASAQQSWPRTLQGTDYSEEGLRNQVTALAKRYEVCLVESKRLPEFHNRLSAYSAQLEQRLFEAQAARSEFARQFEIVRMNEAIADLSVLQSQVEALADSAGFLLDGSRPPSVDQLIEDRSITMTEDRFNELLTMPLE